MTPPIEREETVTSREGILERSSRTSLLKSPNIPKLDSQVTTKRVENFTCPACKEALKEAITVNGRVKGWCGNTHTYINQEV